MKKISNKEKMIKKTLAEVDKWIRANYQKRPRVQLPAYKIARFKECPISCLQISIIKKRIQLDEFGRNPGAINWRKQEDARIKEPGA